ncbi:MAG: T9SS type A sorting domain-containing protein, partial [Bacteroidota bacterium]|nr:T9SS type A sorting domain-containing protein [Bacteroidota bacterium]
TYPVPATTTLNVEVRADRQGVISMQMIDALGRTVLQHSNEAFMEGELRTVTLDLGAVNNGSYLMTILQNGVVIRTDRVMVSK